MIKTIVLLFPLFLGSCFGGGVHDLTTSPVLVPSSSDYYKPGPFPFNLRIITTPLTEAMGDFSLSFYEIIGFLSHTYKAGIVIRTDGSSWKTNGFATIPDDQELALLPGVTIPSPDSNGFYYVDLQFSDEGLYVQIMGREVLIVDEPGLADEFRNWELDPNTDVAVGLGPITEESTVSIQLFLELICPAGTYKTLAGCEPCAIGYFSTEQNSESCTACPSGTSTLAERADAASKCIEVCTVPPVTGSQTVSPPVGSRVPVYFTVNATCSSGTAPGGGSQLSFLCHDNTFNRFGYPSCTDSYRRVVVCGPYNTAQLLCGPGQKLRFFDVSWGASSPDLCSRAPEPGVACTSVAESIIERCTDQEECSVTADVEVLGEPCEGVPKMLYIEYLCMSYPREGYAWQRIPKHSTLYDVRDQPLQIRFTPKPGSVNTTRVVKFVDTEKITKRRVKWSNTSSRLTECRPADSTLGADWWNLLHHWTLTLTEDFFVLANNGSPYFRVNLASDDYTDDDTTTCLDAWNIDQDFSYVRIHYALDNLNTESWFYTTWNPEDWVDIVDKANLRVYLTDTPLSTHYLQIQMDMSLAIEGKIQLMFTGDQTPDQGPMMYVKSNMKYWVWGCTEEDQPLPGSCDSGLWEFLVQTDYLEIACEGVTLLHFEYTAAPITPDVCTGDNLWGGLHQITSLQFYSDTASVKYRLVTLPWQTDEEEESPTDTPNPNPGTLKVVPNSAQDSKRLQKE